jgi:hypothetical protein
MKLKFIFFSVIFGNSLIFPKTVTKHSIKNTKHNFYTNLGKCIDSLHEDIKIFPYNPINYEIYTKDLEFVDPTGVTTYGIDRYKQNLSLIRLFRNIIGSKVTINYRLNYESEDQKIIIIWNSIWKTNIKSSYIDIVSTFYLNDEGYIRKHAVDRVIQHKNNIWNDLTNQILFGDISEKIYAYDNFIQDHETNNLGKLIDTCQYVWDCESPLDCCDFVLFKTCCNTGLPINPEPIPIPIPVEPKKPKYVL